MAINAHFRKCQTVYLKAAAWAPASHFSSPKRHQTAAGARKFPLINVISRNWYVASRLPPTPFHRKPWMADYNAVLLCLTLGRTCARKTIWFSFKACDNGRQQSKISKRRQAELFSGVGETKTKQRSNNSNLKRRPRPTMHLLLLIPTLCRLGTVFIRLKCTFRIS